MLKTFSKKEAILHGFNMTKKYFGVIFIMLIIFVAFGLANGQLDSLAGKDRIEKSEINWLYKNRSTVDKFYQYFIDVGYINQYGLVEPELADIKSISELNLPSEFEEDRTRIYEFLEIYMYRLPFPKVVYYILSFVFWVLSMLLTLGFVRVSLMLSRDKRPEISMLYSSGPWLIAYILATICYGLAIMGGILLLIVPGIIFSVALGMYPYFIIDKKMGPMESLKASRALTKGVRWQLFVFGCVIVLLNLGGLLCLIVGLLWTIPTSYIAMAYVYDQLSKQSELTGNQAASLTGPVL